MRITVTLKDGCELDSYIKEQVEKTGLSSAQCMMNIALQGLEYKQALNTMGTLAKALQEQSK